MNRREDIHPLRFIFFAFGIKRKWQLPSFLFRIKSRFIVEAKALSKIHLRANISYTINFISGEKERDKNCS